jgi:hypothetical protein
VARTAGGAAGVVTGAGGAASGVQRGIQTHGGRGDSNSGSGSGRAVNGTARPSNPVAGGIGAHSQRQPRPPKKDDE